MGRLRNQPVYAVDRPTSSVFDIATYLLMYFVLCPMLTGGQLYTRLTDPNMQAL